MRYSFPLKVLLIAGLCAFVTEPTAAQRRRRPPSVDALFKKFDKNNDGKLVQSEVPARLWKRLVRADADKDGAVTKKELEAFRKSKKKKGKKKKKKGRKKRK